MYYYKDMLLKQILLTFLALLLTINNAFAFVSCQPKYDSDKRSLPSKRGSCGVCHINPSGSGPQNAFGTAFKNAGFMITDELVAKFPELFQQPKDKPPSNPEGAGVSSSGQAVAPPVIKRIKPKSVKINVQSMASIMGKNFVDGAKAFIDNNEVVTTFKSKVLLVIDFILNSVGKHELKVKNPDGQESNTIEVKTNPPKK